MHSRAASPHVCIFTYVEHNLPFLFHSLYAVWSSSSLCSWHVFTNLNNLILSAPLLFTAFPSLCLHVLSSLAPSTCFPLPTHVVPLLAPLLRGLALPYLSSALAAISLPQQQLPQFDCVQESPCCFSTTEFLGEINMHYLLACCV